jgi:hypothetical protein
MPSEIDMLVEWLLEAETLLRTYGETHWANWLANDAKRISRRDGFGLEHLLSAYGGMGSFNDVALQKIGNGASVRLPHDDNERFDKLRGEIHDTAKRLRDEWSALSNKTLNVEIRTDRQSE